MPRANRHFLPGHVWHITYRCHKQEFLLKFAKDRDNWIKWLYEAKKRYGLCILNYIVTSNHIHLLVKDTKEDVIPKSLQLIAGRTAQQYDLRKNRKGAFWEDRYHSTAIESDGHLFKCLVYRRKPHRTAERGTRRWPTGLEYRGFLSHCSIIIYLYEQDFANYSIPMSDYLRMYNCQACTLRRYW